MKSHSFWFWLHGAFLSLALTACSADPASLPSDGLTDPGFTLQITRGRNIVAPLTRRGSAISVAVGVDGKLVWAEGFGYRTLERIQPVSAQDAFRLYSLMKPVTALLALQSVLRGEIAFDTTAREVFPDLPLPYEQVSLQQLLTHTAGVRHYFHPQEAISFEHCERAETAIHKFVNDSLLHEPGSQESYSTYGFVLASAMLEARSGTLFSELVNQRLAEQAGVTLQTDAITANSELKFYDVDDDGRTEPALPVDNSCKMGGGGFRGSAQDLVRIHNAALNGEVAPLPAIQQLLGGRKTLTSGGSGVGGEAVSIVDFDSRVSVVILSNTSGLEQRMALQRARELLVAVFSE